MIEDKPLKLVLLDDVKEVRQLITRFLVSHGMIVRPVATAADLLYAMKAEVFDVAILDILLSSDSSIKEARELFYRIFPAVPFNDSPILAELVAKNSDPVSGKYLLPMVKAASPETVVLMLTNTWDGPDDEAFLNRWGSYTTIQKLAADDIFESPQNAQNLLGLDIELVKFLRDIKQAKQGQSS